MKRSGVLRGACCVKREERKNKWLEKAERLLGEAGKRGTHAELLLQRLGWEDWETVRRETVEFAKGEIRRRKWRGARKGVLPDGCDAEDVTENAISELVTGKGRLAVGWVRSRLVEELRRLVRQKVRLLHRRREVSAMRGEWDVGPCGEEGKRESAFRNLADSNGNGEEVSGDWREVFEQLRDEIEKKLEREPELKAVFGCWLAGVTKVKEIAGKLGMEEAAVMRAKKRLDRRLARWREDRKSKRRKQRG